MIANAQMDNERASQAYQIQLLKDKLEDVEEARAQLNREHREKCREFELLKRANEKLSEEYKLVEGQLNERDSLIEERGLVIVLVENEDGTDAKRTLVSVENADLLGSVQGSLGKCYYGRELDWEFKPTQLNVEFLLCCRCSIKEIERGEAANGHRTD